MIILILNFLFMFFFLITLCEFLGKRYTTFGLSKPKASIFLFGSLSIFICIISVILEYLYSNKFNNYLLYDLIIIIILLFLIIKSKSGKVINLKQDEYDIVTESKIFTLNGESNIFLISNLVKKNK